MISHTEVIHLSVIQHCLSRFGLRINHVMEWNVGSAQDMPAAELWVGLWSCAVKPPFWPSIHPLIYLLGLTIYCKLLPALILHVLRDVFIQKDMNHEQSTSSQLDGDNEDIQTYIFRG